MRARRRVNLQRPLGILAPLLVESYAACSRVCRTSTGLSTVRVGDGSARLDAADGASDWSYHFDVRHPCAVACI